MGAVTLSPVNRTVLVLMTVCVGAGGLAYADGALAVVTLRPGESYLRLDGTPRFLLGRNPTGWETGQFTPLFRAARDSGEKLVRIHLTNGMAPHAAAGEIDEAWARRWEQVFDQARADGLYVLPVFGVWADWNDGSRGETWHGWETNPYNAAKGGVGRVPAEILGDTVCRRQWLQWLEALVVRWRDRPEIVGWEVFSELDLVSGATEAAGVEFMVNAAAVVRQADPRHRPVTASLAGINEWPQLFASNAVDLVQVHPYANLPRYKGELSALILDCVRARLARYGKPVLIGESGLDSRPPQGTLVQAPGAPIEINHALWAALVSGAAVGRMLWWEDGYDQYSGLDLRTAVQDASAPVARFAAAVDFTGFRPVAVTMSEGVKGAVLGNDRCLVGWFKDARCVPPDWPVQSLEAQSVTLNVAGAAAWHVEFTDPRSGLVTGQADAQPQEGRLALSLPAFSGSIAFKLTAAP